MQPQLLRFDVPANEPLLASAHRLACWQWGEEAAAETVVCVHGLTRNARDFDFLAQALAKKYRVLCPDMPGRGQSGWLANPAGYGYPAYLADITFLLTSLQLSRVHWLGTSMGGILGMMLAGTGCIASLILNDIGCLIPAAGLKRIMSYAGVKMQFSTRAEAEATLREICAPFGIRDEAHWHHFLSHSITDAPDGGSRFSYDPAIVAAAPKSEAIADINLWPFWEATKHIPVLLLRGEQSDILTRETARQMQAMHPALTLREIPGAGHAPALMESGQIRLIEEWLEKDNPIIG